MLLFIFTLYAAFTLVAIAFWLSRVGLLGPNLVEIEMSMDERKIFFYRFLTCFFLVSMILLTC